jgi:hypothetical protein
VLALVLPAGPSNEVSLVAADAPGADPFVAGGTVNACSADGTEPARAAGGARDGKAAPSYPGTTPGLYSGTQGASTCNTDQIIAYLKANPNPAAAWAGVPRIPPSSIRAYITGLVPVILRTDPGDQLRVARRHRDRHPGSAAVRDLGASRPQRGTAGRNVLPILSKIAGTGSGPQMRTQESDDLQVGHVGVQLDPIQTLQIQCPNTVSGDL